jgi:lipopolysaccharide/colanic/teichoic acid biosynthesis glycosyltransferase
MSKVGLEYIESEEHAAFNTVWGSLLAGASTPAALAVAVWTMGEHRTLDPFYKSERVSGKVYLKFMTMPPKEKQTAVGPQGGTDHPDASKYGRIIRKGADEIPQLWQAAAGSLAVCGPRDMDTANFDATKESAPPGLRSEWFHWLQIKAGVFSSAQAMMKGIPDHTAEGIAAPLRNQKMALEIIDCERASFKSEMKIMSNIVRAVRGRPIDLSEENMIARTMMDDNWISKRREAEIAMLDQYDAAAQSFNLPLHEVEEAGDFVTGEAEADQGMANVYYPNFGSRAA